MSVEMLLTTKGLTKKYGKQEVIKDLSLAIPKNTVYGLLGPNGAGKSTTLKMITGIAQPTSGQIYYRGKPWQRNTLNEIGALIEEPPLYSNLTAFENLLVRTTSLGLPQSRINEVLETVSLTNTGKKKVRQFSLGMKQRLGIALALVNSPRLLILDEPTNGLDPLGIEALRKLIRSFPKKGMTVIFSSHILAEVENVVDEIGIIANGKLGYQGRLPDSTEKLEKLFMAVVGQEQADE
ncbi:lantibiotic protection ABC transporter ATP-binding protein [Lactobacillus sp. ESL0791]|uniref:lantibiotic protection ABC transporter ATP-binding protein n=1 Tax=Lactobacillus sp. ESL0791 TaxID=2983234 RepID=UPI0023F74376|nr:lantibiotic protection ABC transporter ATP-binding protein [Lactobacillus sp. ESL0791]MDF7639820.1 lantibiotic protection ABC transporter ATP-binding protein [Lactobacillus sp. ESL0791]